MVYINDFIWREDHMAYHITTVDNMNGICDKGLLPLCGERSKSVGDDSIGIHFSDSLTSIIEDWMDMLYENKDKNSLEVLRFNLKGLKWKTNYMGDYYVPGDWYLVDRLLPEYIEYLRIINNGIYEHASDSNDLYYKEDNKIWIPIKEYRSKK